MNNLVLKWALQTLQMPSELAVSDPVSQALELVGIDAGQIQLNSDPLESIFSRIGEASAVTDKKFPVADLDVGSIVYPQEDVVAQTLAFSNPPRGWEIYYEHTNLALALIEKHGTFLSISAQCPYISFYDVVKTAAAMHDCLECGEPENPFLLISGDFSGIQETIYTIHSSGALKTLRARSFMLELLTEHIIYEIQQATSSERYSLIYSGGGSFSLIVPNTERNRMATNDFGQVINTWLLEQFGIQLFLALHCEPLSADNLKENEYKDTWDLIGNKLGKQKQRKFWQSDSFKVLFHPKMPVHVENWEACQITGRDDLPKAEMVNLPGVGRVSKLAYRLWRLGDLLTEISGVVRLNESKDDYRRGTLLFPTHQRSPNGFQYTVYKVIDQRSQESDYEARWVVNSWDLNKYDENTYPLLFGKYVRSVSELPNEAQEQEREKYRNDNEGREMLNLSGATASFSGLAKAAQGSELIGCLRMDVDDSGNFFPQSDLNLGLGIARSSNLSRSLNLFFKGYLNQICNMHLGADISSADYPLDITDKKQKKSGRDVSIVYAGGDDLFIVGAWDDVAELAFDINVCFKAFTCQNPAVHLSGGVTLHKPKFPLYQMANMAKRAEVVAKSNKGTIIGASKNSLALFYSTELKTRNILLDKRIKKEKGEYPAWNLTSDRIAIASNWEEYEEVIDLTKKLQASYSNLPHGFYRKLFETLKIWQEDGKLYIPMLRRILRQNNQLHLEKSLLQHIKQLHIPLHWIEYLNR